MLEVLSRLPVIEKFVRYWKIFRRYTGLQIVAYILISLLVTMVESVGIGLFFPLLSGLQGGSEPSSKLERTYASFLGMLGLEFNLKSILASILFVFLLKAIIQFSAGAYQGKIISDFLATITKKVYGAVTEQDYHFFLSRNVGVLSNVIVNETVNSMAALMRYAMLFPSLIAISVFGVLAFRIDWQLTVGALLFGVAVLFLTRSVARLAKHYSYVNTDAMGRLSELVLQSLSFFKYLRSTSSLGPLRVQVEGTVDRLANSQFYRSTIANFSQALNEPVVIVFLVGLVWHQTLVANQPLAQVAVLALLFYRLIKEVMIFQICWHAFSATMGSIDLLSRVIQEGERGREVFSGRAYGGLKEEIRFQDVSYSYDTKRVITGLNLSIPKNLMVAVVGESGSGKSTFVDLLTGLLKPATGQILLDSIPYGELDLSSLRVRLGYVPQEPALFNDTIANNISLWAAGEPESVRRRVREAAEAASCLGFLERLPNGLDTMLGDRGVNLSGGQKQRVAIARELFKSPDLLILDEATSALDSEAELEIQQSIERLKGKLTVVAIAHRLSTIRNADKIFVLSNGRLAEEGAFQDLFSKDGSLFRKFCDLQGLR